MLAAYEQPLIEKVCFREETSLRISLPSLLAVLSSCDPRKTYFDVELITKTQQCHSILMTYVETKTI